MFQVSVKVTFHAYLRQKFGEESLYQDVMNALLPNAYEAAVKSWS